MCLNFDLCMYIPCTQMDAVKMILQPDMLGANDPVSQAKLYFTETRDVEGTLAKMPNYKPRECMVLKALQRYGFDEVHQLLCWLQYWPPCYVINTLCVVRVYQSPSQCAISDEDDVRSQLHKSRLESPGILPSTLLW